MAQAKHPSTRSETKSGDRIPFGEKLIMGGGGLAQMMTDHGIMQLANAVYNMVLGLNPAVISTVFGAVRIWDAITDPLMGSISDNTRSRFGRRRPYLLAGALLCGIGFPLVWCVPTGWSATAIAAYFAAATFLFYTFATVYGVSFQALLTEMTPDYEERTRVTSFVYFFQSIGWLIFPLAFWCAQFDLFGSTMGGMRVITVVMGLLILVLGVTCALKTKERYLSVAGQQEKVPLMRAVRTTFTNRPFLLLIGICIFMQIGNQMVNTLGSYLNMYYVYDGDLKAGAKIGVIMASCNVPLSMLVVAVVGHYFANVEKKKILLVGMALALVGTVSKWFMITPVHPYWQIIPPLIMTPGNACFWMLIASLRADVCDHDELHTGTRSEGMFGSVHTWIMKFSFSIVIGISGFILVWVGFDQGRGGEQSEYTYFLMRFLYSFVPSLSIVIGIVLVALYPLTKGRMREIREELERRRVLPEVDWGGSSGTAS